MENLTVDFMNVKSGYKSKAWILEEEKQERLKGKLKKWRASSGGLVEVRRGKLYYDGKLVTFHKYGGKGTIYSGSWRVYQYGDKYNKKSINDSFIEYLKKYMSHFKIEED